MKIKDSPQVTSCWLFFKQLLDKVSVIFTLKQVMKVQRVSKGRSILSLTSALDGGEGSKPRSGRFTHGKETLYSTYFTEGWVEKRDGLAG